MREKIFPFGSGGITGVLAEPDASAKVANAPCLITTNVGMHTRIGPGRLYVELARKLADAGISSLRFDLPGMGDSPSSQAQGSELDRAVAEIRMAMDALTSKVGIKRFVHMGICSGIDSVHAVSVQDERVCGSIFVEGYTFRTPEFYVRRYIERIRDRALLKRAVKRRVDGLVARLRGDPQETQAQLVFYSRTYPSQQQLSADYQRLLARNVRMLFVFAGGIGADHSYNYRRQLFHNFPVLAQSQLAELDFLREADHVFSLQPSRALLLERVLRWFESHYLKERASAA